MAMCVSVAPPSSRLPYNAPVSRCTLSNTSRHARLFFPARHASSLASVIAALLSVSVRHNRLGNCVIVPSGCSTHPKRRVHKATWCNPLLVAPSLSSLTSPFATHTFLFIPPHITWCLVLSFVYSILSSRCYMRCWG